MQAKCLSGGNGIVKTRKCAKSVLYARERNTFVTSYSTCKCLYSILR